MSPASDDKLDRIFLGAVFAAAAVVNFILATYNWHWGFLIGHEFRQAQTAIISYYIEQQNNFSLHYQTPILGKPWEFPLEFPLYQWCVVLLSRVTHWPHFESARALSLASVYLALPAVNLLLAQAGLARSRRLLVLALLLATPVYVFYGRSFLMDTMAMMFSAWFLAAFVATMQTRRFSWLIVASVAGAAGGLIKSLTFFVWLFPAALFGAWCLWSDLRRRAGWRAVLRTVGWGFGAVIVPAVAVTWWVRFTDAIKEHHASAYIFTSKGLTHGNFGMYEFSSRLSLNTWKALFDCWSQAIAKPWVIFAVLLAGIVFCKGDRWRVAGAFLLFIAAQMMFPYAYAYQDYYFTACAVFGVCAIGFALNGIFSLKWSRWLRWPLVLAPFVAFYAAYAGYYFQEQSVQSYGGTGLTIALRDYLPKQSVLLIAGADWAAIIPYYSQHRALMIRRGLEFDDKYLTRAFNEISDEDVSALVLTGDQRSNRDLLKKAAAKFGFDLSPTFTYTNADVYVSDLYRPAVLRRLQAPPLPEGISFDKATVTKSLYHNGPTLVPPPTAAVMFPMIAPHPWKFQFAFGYDQWVVDGATVLNAHPDSDIWVKAPAGAQEIVCEFGIRPEAYTRADKTNGADFSILLELADGTTRTVFSRYLNPKAEGRDQGQQKETIPVLVKPGESLVFRTRPHGNYAFDWCYWKSISVH